MGVLTRQLASVGKDPLHNFWYGPIGRRVASGVDVTHDTAMNYSAVWAATRLYTETIATLPRVLFRRQQNRKDHAIGHPAYKLFRNGPNPEQSGVTYWSQSLNFCINWGDTFSEIIRDGGRTTRLWPIHPSRIPKRNIKRDENGELVYHVRNDGDLGTTEIKRKDMFHIPGIMSEDGITGKGVIQHAAESIGMGLATEQYGATIFGNGGRPSIVMTHPKSLGPEASDNLRRAWNKTYRGPADANGVLVLEEGTTVSPLTIPPEQGQFLETRQFNVTEIARWYNLPPHLLRELSKSSFSNIESESLHFVLISLMPWLVKLEEECNRQLLSDVDQDAGFFFKFMLQGLLRGDMAARSAFYKEMFMMGAFSINDILELEDRNPIGPKGDIRLVPSNMWTIEAAMKTGADETLPDETPQEPTEQSANIQAEALNGGQISALLNIATGVVSGTMPPDGSKAMLQGAFPEMETQLIDTLVDDFAKAAEEREPEETSPVENQNGTEGDGEDDTAESTSTTLAAAAQSVLTCTLSGLIGYEARQAVRAAVRPREFEAWCDDFYETKFSATFSEQVTPLLSGAMALGVNICGEDLTISHCEQSRSDLLALLDVPMNDFANAVQSTVDGWAERALEESKSVFAKETENVEP